MSENYIKNHFDDIKEYASIIENRLDDGYCTLEHTLQDNIEVLKNAKEHNLEYVLIDEEYLVDFEI